MLQETLLQDTLLQDVTLGNSSGDLAEQQEVCPNCEEIKYGKFCSSCGAEGLDLHHELSLKHFLGHSLHEITHIENSKVGKTLWALLLKPGQLTLHYFAGKKSRYLSPLRIFLLIFALSVFAYSFSASNRLYDVELMVKQDVTGALSAKMNTLAQKKNVARPEMVQQLNQNWQRYMSWSQFSYVLFLALLMKMAFRKRYFVEHVIFSFHFISYSLLFAVLLWPVYYLAGLGPSTANFLVGIMTYLVSGTYLAFALKRMYTQTWKRIIPKAAFLLLGYYLMCSFVYLVTLLFAIAAYK